MIVLRLRTLSAAGISAGATAPGQTLVRRDRPDPELSGGPETWNPETMWRTEPVPSRRPHRAYPESRKRVREQVPAGRRTDSLKSPQEGASPGLAVVFKDSGDSLRSEIRARAGLLSARVGRGGNQGHPLESSPRT
ncbi:MAG: hypothetical protein LBT40_13250 [Deltaproteobacteria bacterium]|nr:hypothetical protein [Deltaproteobacteria bacterium]